MRCEGLASHEYRTVRKLESDYASAMDANHSPPASLPRPIDLQARIYSCGPGTSFRERTYLCSGAIVKRMFSSTAKRRIEQREYAEGQTYCLAFMQPSAHFTTLVTTTALLLAVFGSVTALITVALLLKVPVVAVCTAMVTWTIAPVSRFPNEQVTLAVPLQLP